MTVLMKTGSFAANTSTGNQSVTGVGFQPKLVLFFPTTLTSDATFAGTRFAAGVGVSSTSRFAVSASSTANVTTTACRTSYGNTRCIIVRQSDVSAFEITADFVSQDVDGFTINITNAPSSAYIINYVALGGTDITNITTGSFQAPTSTSSSSVTGVGFQPDSVFMFSSANSASGPTLTTTIGACNGTVGMIGNTGKGTIGQQIFNGSAASSAGRNLKVGRVDAAFNVPAISTATFSSFDIDGFTLSWTKSNSVQAWVYYVAIKGLKTTVGSLIAPTTSGQQFYTTQGLAPKGIILISKADVASNTTDYTSVIGSGCGSDRFCVASKDTNAVSPTDSSTELSRTLIYKALDGGRTADYSGEYSNGFKLNWTVTSSRLDELIYMAIGSPATDTGSFLNVF